MRAKAFDHLAKDKFAVLIFASPPLAEQAKHKEILFSTGAKAKMRSLTHANCLLQAFHST